MEHNSTQLPEKKKNKISFCTILSLYTDFMSYCLSAEGGREGNDNEVPLKII